MCALDVDAEPEDLAALPLRCAAASEGDGPGTPCRQASDCDHGICLLSGACALPCATVLDCSAHERCQAVLARSSADTLQPTTTCVAMVDLPDDADVQTMLHADALSGGRDTVSLAAPGRGADTVYVLEHSEGTWPDGRLCRPPLCVVRIETDGPAQLLFDAERDYSTEAAPRVAAVPGDHANPVSFRVDAALASELAGADLQVTLDTEVAGDLRVTRIHRTRRGQRLDLNVFYLGGLDWEPTGSRGPALLADALDVVDEIFAPADVFIGDVRQLSVPGMLPERGLAFPDGDAGAGFDVLEVRFGVYVELPHLFMLSAGAANTAVNLFFVRDIRPRAGGEPEAQAGGVPGPPGMHGTAGSGIAVSTDMMSGDATGLGRTLAHELSHYLGLLHTSESTGDVFEALTDTPECRPGDDCTDHEQNLMWWALADGVELTAEQLEVLRGSALLQ